MKPGERAIAIMEAKNGVVRYFGAGVFAGDFVPDADAVGWAKDLHAAGVSNPRIDLDLGGHVWGCECWWGPEEKGRARYADWTWTLVSIDEIRAEIRARETP